jgi:hypothetical protein
MIVFWMKIVKSFRSSMLSWEIAVFKSFIFNYIAPFCDFSLSQKGDFVKGGVGLEFFGGFR